MTELTEKQIEILRKSAALGDNAARANELYFKKFIAQVEHEIFQAFTLLDVTVMTLKEVKDELYTLKMAHHAVSTLKNKLKSDISLGEFDKKTLRGIIEE